MKKHIAIAALAFGVVLASVPAFAAGRAANDGGPADVSAPPASKPIYNSVSAAPAHYGKGLDDGGIVDNVNGTAPKITPVQSQPHVGRAMNDGGM
jgi:hypothetical protein